MATASNRAARPTAIRLVEVENSLLDVLEARGVLPGQVVAVGEIEMAMDARGYPGKWVKRAVESMIRKGWLRSAGTGALETAELPSAAARMSRPRALRSPSRQKRRRPLLF